MKKMIFILFFCLFLLGCNEQEKKIYLKNIESEYMLYVDDEINFLNLISLEGNELIIENNSDTIINNNGIIKAVKEGKTSIVLKVNDERKEISIIVKEIKDFTIDDIELYIGETKELNITIIKGNLEELVLEAENENILIKDNKFIEAIKIGTTNIKATLGETVKNITVTVKDLEIKILNENFDVDVFETLELLVECPDICKDKITFKVYREEVIKIDNNVIIPLSEGTSRVKVMIDNNDDYSVNFMVNVTVDPIDIIKKLHNEEALMRKSITLYGSTNVTQEFMGSVSKYMFDILNLEKRIIDIYENPYVGMVATKEIVEALDRKGYPRSGVKMEKIQYITYHDTGNSAAGANALSNANWMTNQYSVTTSARSWHYTVDENKVIQSIPDDEITFQGDNYDAYTKSIGIETCVNAGANMDVIWHRMGKLCAQLMTKYDLEVKDIKQHYDWSLKNCPQTLRRNGLYNYAISLVEAELLVRRYLSKYDIKFESLNPEYVDFRGQVIKAPEQEITVGYEVTITNSKGYNEKIILYTKIGALK